MSAFIDRMMSAYDGKFAASDEGASGSQGRLLRTISAEKALSMEPGVEFIYKGRRVRRTMHGRFEMVQ